MLRANSLIAGYKNHAILKDLDLKVDPGEIIVIIGPNGSGKTTLVTALSGGIRALAGSVTVNNIEIQKMRARERAQLISVVPQHSNLPPGFTVSETVSFGRTPYLNYFGKTTAEDERITYAAMERVNALLIKDRLVGEISGGERQRVLLARAIAQQTPILLLDEPTTYLDLHYQVNFLDTIKNLARQDHKTILLALHDLNQAARVADRILLLKNGECVAIGTPKEVLREDLISSVYQLSVKVKQIEGEPGFILLPEN